MSTISTKLTIPPLGHSWHCQDLHKDLGGLLCRSLATVCLPTAQECPGDSLAAPAEAAQWVGNPSGEYSPASVNHLDALCTSCDWQGPLWRAECFSPKPPAVVIGCPVCASALWLAS